MSKRILSFKKFNSLNEEVSAPQPTIIQKALSQASEIQAAKSKVSSDETPSSFGKIKLRDLFFATNLGQNILSNVDENPELKKALEKAKIIPTDSPDSAEEIAAGLEKDAQSKKAAEENINSLNKSGVSTSSPKYSELIQSPDYKYDDVDELDWDSLKFILDKEGISKSLDFEKYNLIGLRNYLDVKKDYPNRFTDVLFLISPEKEKKVFRFPATTVPGPFFMVNKFRNWYLATGAKNTLNPEGLSILQPGVYDYTIGKHKGQYEALIQKGPVTVERFQPVDDPKKANFSTFSPGKIAKGNFGINIHRGLRDGVTPTVDSHSAGCIVLKDSGDLRKILKELKDFGQNDIKFALIELDEIPNQVLAQATKSDKSKEQKTSKSA
jgi:hypothetical protein